jgi:molecular chaperone GrpE
MTDEPVTDRERVSSGEVETADEAEAAEQVSSDIAALAAERDQFKDIAVRLQADFENYRKRISAQSGEEAHRATARLVEELLPVLDACEAAFAHGAEQVEPIWSALIGALQKQGLEAMDIQGKPFDPAEADAVLHEEGDVDEPLVAEVMRTGYRWKGRVLRPAMVKVKG